VALSRFIDDASVLAIEDCLISKLPELFEMDEFLELSDGELARLAGETDECSAERKHLEAMREILDSGLQSLKSLQKQRKFATPSEWSMVSTPDADGPEEAASPPTSSTSPSVFEAPSAVKSEDRPPLPDRVEEVDFPVALRSITPEDSGWYRAKPVFEFN
jgi:hypothetical protein